VRGQPCDVAVGHLVDPGDEPALRRARLRAIEVARATNTCLVVYRDGQIVLIPPHELPVE
jgi:hypothetical protein